jgi:hypothetical protein
MKKGMMPRSALVFLAAFILLTVYGLDAHAFRCGDEIIGTGDSRSKVSIKCGPPTYKERVSGKKGARAGGGQYADAKHRSAHGKKKSSAKGLEKWSYNCGKDDFIYVLTFEGGVVTKIDTDGRGTGASQCRGR